MKKKSILLLQIMVILLFCKDGFAQDKFELNVIVKNMKSETGQWVLYKVDPNIMQAPIDLDTGESNHLAASLIQSKNGHIKINSFIEEPSLYKLFNREEKKSFSFMLEKGVTNIEIDMVDVRNTVGSFPLVKFKSDSKINEDLELFRKNRHYVNHINRTNIYHKYSLLKIEEVFKVPYKEYFSLWLSQKLDDHIEKNNIDRAQTSRFLKQHRDSVAKHQQAFREIVSNFYESHPNSLFAFNLLVPNVYTGTIKRISLSDRSKHLRIAGDNVKRSNLYRYLMNVYNSLDKVKVGAKAPDFELIDQYNEKISLSDFIGNVVLIEFWESGCENCSKENRNLHTLYSKYSNEDFEIVSVSFDMVKQDWLEALKQNGNPWTNLIEPIGFEKSPIIKKYQGATIPYYFLIDKNGEIISKHLRGPSVSNDEAHNLNIQLEKIFNY